jgi:large subunit ribosomal protein L22
MNVIATAKYVHQSPSKVRLVTSAVSHMSPSAAMSQLQLMNKLAAKAVSDVLQSAVANATNNFKLEADSLRIHTLEVNEGPMLKRSSPRSRGRANTMLRRMSHIRVILTDEPKPVKAKRKEAMDAKEKAPKKVYTSKAAKVENIKVAEETKE